MPDPPARAPDPKDTHLFDLVFQRISESPEGAIPFSLWMEAVLYDPVAGYYTRAAETPDGKGFRALGRKGDFFTSVSVGDTFGFLLASAILGARALHFDKRAPFVIVEQGAHDGRLARDISAALRESPEAAGMVWEYRIIEPRAELQLALETQLREENLPIRIVPSVEEARAPQGIFLCNELLDAFPVDRLRFTGGTWREEWVTLGEAGFQWSTRPLRPEWESFAAEMGTAFPEGYRTEVCPDLGPWVEEIATLFDAGIWWILDYGHEAADYRDPARKEGGLRAYRGHHAAVDLLADPGLQDLTADVDFTRLADLAVAAGLRSRRFTDQHHFLVEAARPWLASLDGRPPAAPERKRLRQFQTLTHPAMMGRQFKLLELDRGLADRDA